MSRDTNVQLILVTWARQEVEDHRFLEQGSPLLIHEKAVELGHEIMK